MFQYPHPPRKLPINLFLRLELPRSMSPSSELFTSMSFHSCPWYPLKRLKDRRRNRQQSLVRWPWSWSQTCQAAPPSSANLANWPGLPLTRVDEGYQGGNQNTHNTNVSTLDSYFYTKMSFLGQKHLVSLFIDMSKVRYVVANGWFSLWRFNQSKAQTTHNQETNKLLETIENPETANPAEQLTRQDKNMIKYINAWHVNTLCYISFQDWYTTPWKLVVIVNVL